MRTIDDLAAEWEAQRLASLRRDIYELHLRKKVHDEFMELLRRNGQDGSIFADLFHKMYLDSQVMAIRRQTDDDTRTLSLYGLLGQLQEGTPQSTRAWYVNRWLTSVVPSDPEERELHTSMANEAFDRFCDWPAARKLGKGRLQADRQELEGLTERVVKFVNTFVAHRSRTTGPVTLTYQDFEGAIAHLGEMLLRYFLLLNQGGLLSATPVIQGDPLAPFRRALT
ncbi:MAG: hypothetical protein ACRDJU_14605 [Actinomycetota bacterium]